MSVSNSLNFAKEPIFFSNSHPHQLVESFIEALEILLPKAKQKWKTLSLISRQQLRLGSIMEKLLERHNQPELVRRIDMNQDESENRNFAFTRILQMQKNHLFFSTAIAVGTILYCTNCVWLQQCKISQFIQIFFATHSRLRTRFWIYCHQESKPVHFVHIWWYSAIGYNEFS